MIFKLNKHSVFVDINSYIIILLLISTELFADGPGDDGRIIQLANKAFKEVQDINQDEYSKKDCNTPTSNIIRSCSEVTNTFCSQLWNESNKGNIKVFDGEIKAGLSNKSELSLVLLEDDNALIAAISDLPDDSKKTLVPIISELKNVLSQERDDLKWYRERSVVKWKISNAIQDIIDERFEKHNPEIKIKNSKQWTIDQLSLYKKETRDFNDEIIKAKYSKHPNWLRVEKIFPIMKNNLIKEIEKLKISDVRKKMMIDKLSEIKLSLPLQNTESVMASEECSTSTVNAYYSNPTKKFTLCAGMFNQYQSDSAVAFVIAHEISHSIDSENLADDDWAANSPVAAVLKKLAHSKGPVYTCNQWDDLNKSILKPVDDFVLQNINPLEKLYSCFRGKTKLEEINKGNITSVAKKIVTGAISNFADSNAFTALVQKRVKVNGKEEENETYLRPDKLLERYNGFNDEKQSRDVSPLELFTQNFSCILSKANVTEAQFENLNKETRSKLFENAIDQTSQILELMNLDYFKYCGKNCSQLAGHGLSVNTRENDADWFATLALSSFLESISPENRAEASSLAISHFCDRRDVPNAVSEFSQIEKKYSLEPHPDHPARRASIYTPEVASLVKCKIEDADKENTSCKP